MLLGAFFGVEHEPSTRLSEEQLEKTTRSITLVDAGRALKQQLSESLRQNGLFPKHQCHPLK